MFCVHDDSIFLSVIINLYINTMEYIRKLPKVGLCSDASSFLCHS